MVNLIIATHGEMSKYTVELSKMVLGDFNYLSPVTFLPGEGPENLIEKYKETILNFKNDYGTLFLVDIFGGSPYNAASMLVMQNKNMDVVTGVNVPMLLELLDAREEIDKVEDLKEIAKESGKNGIEVFSEVYKRMIEEQENTNELDDLEEL